MEWKWIVYVVLGLWILGSLFDLVVASLRVRFKTQDYGLPLRSTPSYLVGGAYGLVAFGILVWLFYWRLIGEFWTIMIGGLLWLPLGVYLLWRIYSAPPSMKHDRASTID